MFVCYYCDKEIQGVTIVVDGRHLAHSECDKKNKLEEIESGQESRQNVSINVGIEE